jgi:TonB family protein
MKRITKWIGLLLVGVLVAGAEVMANPSHDPRCADIRQRTSDAYISLIGEAIRDRDACVSTLGRESCSDRIAKVTMLQTAAHTDLAKSDSALCAEAIARDEQMKAMIRTQKAQDEAKRKAEDARATAELKKRCAALKDRVQAHQTWERCLPSAGWTTTEVEAKCGKEPVSLPDDSDLAERCEPADADEGVEGGVEGGLLGDVPLYAGIGGVSNPKLIPASRVMPIYPESARKAGVNGQVTLQAVIHKDGTVGDVTVLKSPGAKFGFDEAAIAAVKQWKYKPGLQNGKPVDVYFTVVVDVDEDPSARPERP